MKQYQNYLVIDTDSYSGNFEREMCAFLTLSYGECGVGEEIAVYERRLVNNDAFVDFICDCIGREPDEHGCWRPVKICQNENTGQYESLEITLDGKLDDRMVDWVSDRIKNFRSLIQDRLKTVDPNEDSYYWYGHLSKVKILGAYFSKREVVTTETKVPIVL